VGLTNNVETSTNWAGYIAGSGSYFTGVRAVLSVPIPGYDSQPTGMVSSWVGIGGADNDQTGDLIQAGIDQEVAGDQVQYSAWYELLPDESQPIDMVINPGDQVEVTIEAVYPKGVLPALRTAAANDNLWRISVQDGDQSFQKTISYTSCHCSAEWIVETPTLGNGQLAPLASFELASIANAQAVADGSVVQLAQLNPTRTILADSRGRALVTPSALGPTGSEFRVLSVVNGS
jgi:hypothetical protein